MSLYVEGFIWLDWVVDKIIGKHGVSPEEVEECFFTNRFRVRRAEAGKYQLFSLTADGRYLFIVFVWEGRSAKIITARDMTVSERRYYGRK